jgi:hypothetical protein
MKKNEKAILIFATVAITIVSFISLSYLLKSAAVAAAISLIFPATVILAGIDWGLAYFISGLYTAITWCVPLVTKDIILAAIREDNNYFFLTPAVAMAAWGLINFTIVFTGVDEKGKFKLIKKCES